MKTPKPFGSRFKPRKRFGQNFLTDTETIERLLQAIHPKPDDFMVEIGPGLGALTKPLLHTVNHLDVIEIDRDLAALLEKDFDPAQLTIHCEDVLRFDFEALIKNKHNGREIEEALNNKQLDGKIEDASNNKLLEENIRDASNHQHPEKKMRIVGNLPYNISTPVIFKLLTVAPLIQDMYFMLQKEVVDRIVAKPNSKAYGRLSVMVQYFCNAELLFTVPKEAFSPAPKVTSAFLRLIPTPPLHSVLNFELFKNLTASAFQKRRKTIANALKEYLTIEDFAVLNIDYKQRSDNLSLAEYVAMSNFVSSKKESMKNLGPDKNSVRNLGSDIDSMDNGMPDKDQK